MTSACHINETNVSHSNLQDFNVPDGMNFYMYTIAVMAIVDDSTTSDCISTLAFVLSISVYRAFFICSMVVSVSSISSTSLPVAS